MQLTWDVDDVIKYCVKNGYYIFDQEAFDYIVGYVKNRPYPTEQDIMVVIDDMIDHSSRPVIYKCLEKQFLLGEFSNILRLDDRLLKGEHRE